MKRSTARQLAHETVSILREGRYTTATGECVDIRDALRRAADGTISYPPEAALPPVRTGDLPTRFEVVNETTLAAARRLLAEGHGVVALNFASAKNPGGGFLNGALAQEESLCRASGLYGCIAGTPMYAHHAGTRGGFYTNYAIYSPDVPVIRTDDGELLAEPYLCSFITAPAVNAGRAARDHGPSAIRDEMEQRVHKVLSLAAGHGHDAAILGAWGCGAFQNDTAMVAQLFHEALTGRFHGTFARVVFAVLDWSDDRFFIGPFQRLFGGGKADPKSPPG
jgi:uncharacterized protein (TIGR02452 family)